MKFVKHLAMMAMVAVAAIASVGCEEPNEGGEQGKNPNLNHNLTLTVDVDNVTAATAKVKVTHNGSSEDTWLGFYTADLAKSEKELIDEQVAAYKAGSSNASLRASNSYVQILTNLSAGTLYKYIAFGLSAEGEVYGNYGVAEFLTQGTTTGGGNSDEGGENGGGGNTEVNGMKVNPAWSVSYIGAGTLYEQPVDNIVKVTSVDSNSYIMTVVYASEWDETQVRELGEYVVDDLVAYIADFNSYNGTSYTIADWLFTGDGYDAFNLYPGYYKALAIGVNTAGALTGLYAVSETFEVKEQVATAAFKAWLGNWEVVGNNNITYTINLSNGLANKFFYMSYWEGDQDFLVEVEYNADLDALFFYSQTVQEEVNFGSAGYGSLYFLGFDRDGGLYTNENGDYGIAIAGTLDGGQKAIVRYDDDSVQGYPFFDYMQFVAIVGGKCYLMTTEENLLQLPAAMNPVGGQVTVAPEVPHRVKPLYTRVQRPERIYTPNTNIFNFE